MANSLLSDALAALNAAQMAGDRPRFVFIGVDRAGELDLPFRDLLFGLRVEFRPGAAVSVW